MTQSSTTITLMEKTRTIAYYIVCTKSYKASSIQRKFGYNFNTCVDVIEILEKLGIISEFDTSKNERAILVGSIEELELKLDLYF